MIASIVWVVASLYLYGPPDMWTHEPGYYPTQRACLEHIAQTDMWNAVDARKCVPLAVNDAPAVHCFKGWKPAPPIIHATDTTMIDAVDSWIYVQGEGMRHVHSFRVAGKCYLGDERDIPLLFGPHGIFRTTP